MFSVNKEELSNIAKAFWYIPFLGVHLEMFSSIPPFTLFCVNSYGKCIFSGLRSTTYA